MFPTVKLIRRQKVLNTKYRTEESPYTWYVNCKSHHVQNVKMDLSFYKDNDKKKKKKMRYK